MSGVLTAFSAAGFARSVVSSIMTRNTRAIVWPAENTQGAAALTHESGHADTPQSGSAGQQVNNALEGYVAILEDHRDELVITKHPVEQGATISDHAYKLPAVLSMQIGWTTSSALASGLPTLLGIVPIPTLAGFFGLGNTNYIKQVYQRLLKLQAQRTLLTVYTGKRVYRNMLLQMVGERTTEHTENALVITAVLEEIIIATVQTVQAPINPQAQAQPQDTTPTQNQGQQSLQPATNFNPSENTAAT